jgi:hypothetical protein
MVGVRWVDNVLVSLNEDELSDLKYVLTLVANMPVSNATARPSSISKHLLEVVESNTYRKLAHKELTVNKNRESGRGRKYDYDLVRKLYSEEGLTQSEIARRIGSVPGTVRKILLREGLIK